MATDFPDLKAWRKRKGITLDSIATSTKLSVRQLEAIESADFSRLPGGIYTTSYLRQYARAVDFDEAELLGCYRAQEAAPSSPLSRFRLATR